MSEINLYPQSELELNNDINKLMSVWREIDTNDAVFCSDGFFPYYTSQKHRVLFVGRESRGIGGLDYINVVLPALHEKILGGCHINQYAFFRRLMYIAYGFQHDFPNFWDELLPADVIATTFGTAEGVSCAYMNISKTSNENPDNWSSDWEAISASLKVSIEKEYIRKEVSLLEPEIIVTLNIEGALEHLVDKGSLKKVGSIESNLDVFSATVKGKKCYIFNTWHFTAQKKDLDCFYAPIQAAYRQYIKK